MEETCWALFANTLDKHLTGEIGLLRRCPELARSAVRTMFLDLLRKSLLSIGGWGLAPKFSTDDTYSTRQQIPRSRRTRDFDCPILQAFGSPLKNRKPRWRAARSVEEPKTTLASGTTPRDEGTRYPARMTPCGPNCERDRETRLWKKLAPSYRTQRESSRYCPERCPETAE